MKKLSSFCLASYAVSGLALFSICPTGWVTFGHGLGDVFDLLLHAVVYLLVAVLAWLMRKASGYA